MNYKLLKNDTKRRTPKISKEQLTYRSIFYPANYSLGDEFFGQFKGFWALASYV
ncbi:MAG: hypothetical protein LAT67_13090 [Balneolales bacterium]|nr:hypothetical protein [Balneolales bacterium]